MDLGSPVEGTERVAREIRAAGNLGLTAAQLARALGDARPEVDRALLELERRRAVVRVGRGLWIDPTLRADPGRARGFVRPAVYLAEFGRDHELTIGRYRGDVQFRPNTEEPVHRWWPYVQGFSAGLVRTVFDRYAIGPGSTVLDPYAGSGTVLVAARTAGARAIGAELMPISAFVARAKQQWEVDPAELRSAARRVGSRAAHARASPGPFLRETQRQFAPGPLRALRKLRSALPAGATGVPALLRLAFARILVDSSRLRRSPCLGYGPKPSVDAAGPGRFYREAIERTATDLHALQSQRDGWGPEAEVLELDSRRLELPAGSVDLAVTSPPYANGMDYVMNYKLELAWLGFARSYADLRALKERMVACDNLPQASLAGRPVAPEVVEDPWIAAILDRVRSQLRAKRSYRRDDMDRVLAGYFTDLVPTMRAVHRALRPGGRYVVVNGDSFLAGTYVPSDLIYGRLAEHAGFEVERIEIARTRRSGQRRDFELRETILTLRKP